MTLQDLSNKKKSNYSYVFNLTGQRMIMMTWVFEITHAASRFLPYLAEPPWRGPAPAPFESAARVAPWQRARRPSSRPGSPPGLYSACPSSAAAGAPPPGAGPPPRAAGLQHREGRTLKPADTKKWPNIFFCKVASTVNLFFFFLNKVEMYLYIN